MVTIRTVVVLAVLMAGVGSVRAQDDAELIMERPQGVKASVRSRVKPKETPVADAPAPTPRPEEIIVALVNNRVLTKAELDHRVSGEYDRIRSEVQSRVGGVVSTLGGGAVVPGAAGAEGLLGGASAGGGAGEDEVLAEQKEAIASAVRREEEVALRAWIDHSMLADEARRQRILISEDEFRVRLAQAERESELDAEKVDSVLARLRLTRADYEKSVYDALMIEKLLMQFNDLNFTEDQYRAAYDKAPEFFYEPARYSIAHFTVALLGDEDPRKVERLKDLAEKVRSELKKGTDPKVLFDRPEFRNVEQGIYGSLPGYYSFFESETPPVVDVFLPRVVELTGRKLKVGETSDVLVNRIRDDDNKVVPISLHVIRILDSMPETGTTFESAKPAIKRQMLEIGREELLKQLRGAKTHRVISNLRGIKPEKLPSAEEIATHEANNGPINLKLPQT
jgi:hypothetical protein